MNGSNVDHVITRNPVTKYTHKRLDYEWIEGFLVDIEVRIPSPPLYKADSTSTMYFAMTSINTPSMWPEPEAKDSPGWKVDLSDMNREFVYAASRFPRETSVNRESWSKNMIQVYGYTPRTTLGKRLLEIRNRLIASGERFLNWEEIEAELAERRGEKG